MIYKGMPVFSSSIMCKKEKRTFKEFFTLKPRFRFKKTSPDEQFVMIDGKLYGHPIMIDRLKKQLEASHEQNIKG